MTTLIDSGATRSCINANCSFIDNLTWTKTHNLLRSCNGEEIQVTKLYTLTFKLGTTTSQHNFLAVPNLNVDAILGLDYIKSLEFNTCFNENLITINNHQVDLANGILEVDCSTDEVKQFHQNRILRFGKIDKFEFQSIGELTTSQKEELIDIFREKELSLARNSSDVGKLFKYRYTLPLYDERETAYLPPRPIPPNLLPKVEAELQKFKDLDIIEPSDSGFNIPMLILKKADGSLRVSLDARQLNQKLIPDRFPLPSMPELLSKVSNRLSKKKGCFVTALDINKAYWQLPVDIKDSHNISFS